MEGTERKSECFIWNSKSNIQNLLPPEAAVVSFSTCFVAGNKCLRMFRVILLFTKGLLRDTRLRRNVMLWVMMAAMAMVFIGSWLMSGDWARRHVWFLFTYWAVCAWLTITGLLLAVFDILIIRATARAMRRRIEEDIAHIDAKTKGGRK